MPTPDYSIILQHLDKMSSKIEELSKEVQQTNIAITKLDSMKHSLGDIKTWKDGIERVVNAEDLREMKTALLEVKRGKEDMLQFEKEIEEIKLSNKEKDKTIDELKTFKTKAVTIGTIIVFAFSTALTIVGWYS